MVNTKYWEEQEIKRLTEMYEEGELISTIVIELNRSDRSICHKVNRLKLSRKKPLKRIKQSVEEKRKYNINWHNRNKEKVFLLRNQRARQLKQDLVDSLGGCCIKCGYNNCLNALDFHHKSGKKEANISLLISQGSKTRAIEEAKKCVVLCSNCHREFHSGLFSL